MRGAEAAARKPEAWFSKWHILLNSMFVYDMQPHPWEGVHEMLLMSRRATCPEEMLVKEYRFSRPISEREQPI